MADQAATTIPTWSQLDEVMTAICDGRALIDAMLLMATGLPRDNQDALSAVAGAAEEKLNSAHDLLDTIMTEVTARKSA